LRQTNVQTTFHEMKEWLKKTKMFTREITLPKRVKKRKKKLQEIRGGEIVWKCTTSCGLRNGKLR